jgi:hypothetical protein
MKQITRSIERIKATGEIFTPPTLVDEILDKFPDNVWLPTKTFLDPTCGSGNILVRIIAYKMWLGSTPEQAMSTTYGVDIMEDNIEYTRWRILITAFIISQSTSTQLLPHLTYEEEQNINNIPEFKQFQSEYQHIVDSNIICYDALTYDYSFTFREIL